MSAMDEHPIKESVPKKVSRRDFMSVLLGGSATGLTLAVLYPVVQFMRPPEVAESTADAVIAAHDGELQPDSWKIFPMGSLPGILIRKPDGDYVAFSAVCTHLQCTVRYRPDYGQIWCPCHNGRFDLTGRNVAGPPPRPLEQYVVNQRGNEIVVSRKTA